MRSLTGPLFVALFFLLTHSLCPSLHERQQQHNKQGHISKAADVYAFGMVLWELYSAQKVFKGIPRALLGHQITQLNRLLGWLVGWLGVAIE